MRFYYTLKKYIQHIMNIIVYGMVCLAIVYLGHYLWNFILDKTTVKKIKTPDKQTEKYKQMFDEYQENIELNKNEYLADDEKIEMIADLMASMGLAQS